MKKLSDILREMLEERMTHFSGNRMHTAASLDVDVRTIRNWLRKWPDIARKWPYPGKKLAPPSPYTCQWPRKKVDGLVSSKEAARLRRRFSNE